MDGTIIGQGSFKQGDTAINQIIQIPSNVDALDIWNYTQAGLGGGNGFHFYWQRGNGVLQMGDGTQGIVEASGGGSSGAGSFGPSASFFGTTTGTGSLGNDYAGTVAVKTAAGTGRLPFPRAGASVPLVNGITAIDSSSFNLAAVGTYQISWVVATTEPAQWQVELNGTAVANTIVVDQNPTAGGHPLTGDFLITTTTPNSVVAIINPAGNATALTITPSDGNLTHAQSPTLTITQISGAGVVPGLNPVSVGQTASKAFVLYDPSAQSAGSQPILGPAVATTATTNATQPVVSTANTAGLAVGSIVRMSNTAQLDVNGIDMVVGAVVANTSFTLLKASNALATAPGVIGGAGFYRIVNYDALFYPRKRVITNIVVATGTVSTAIPHGLTPGQAVRFNIPAVSGTTQLNAIPQNNYQSFTVATVVDDYNFTLVESIAAFTAFTYPTSAQEPVSPPIVVPVGENTAQSLLLGGSQVPTIAGVPIFNANSGILADATVNTGFLGMVLAAGALLPAGVAGDVVFWKAYKSTYGGL